MQSMSSQCVKIGVCDRAQSLKVKLYNFETSEKVDRGALAEVRKVEKVMSYWLLQPFVEIIDVIKHTG